MFKMVITTPIMQQEELPWLQIKHTLLCKNIKLNIRNEKFMFIEY